MPNRDSELDTFKGHVHDINGDGYDDVVADVYRGIRVYWGGSDGLAERRFNEYRTDFVGQAPSNPESFVSDVNSDGFADVIVTGGAIISHLQFRTIRVLYGHPIRLMDSGVAHIVGTLDTIVDLNGDGFVDLVGSAPSDYSPDETVSAMALYGGADWSEFGRVFVEDPSQVEVTAGFGFAGTGGDVDGDGYGDVYIGNARHDRYRGRLYLYRGGVNGIAAAPSRTFDPPPEIDFRAEWGAPLGVGDVNGDRLADLLVLSEDIQQVLMFGARTPEGISSQVIRSTYPTSFFGSATGPSVDFNDDGVMDLFLGCSVCLDRDHPLVTAGRIVVMTDIGRRPPRLLHEFEPPPNDGVRGGSFFGQPVLAIDVNGDGFDDMISQDPETVSPPSIPARGYITVDFGGSDFGTRRLQVFGVELEMNTPLGNVSMQGLQSDQLIRG